MLLQVLLFFSSGSYTAGDVFNIRLDSLYFNTSTPIGSYIVLPGDTNANVVAGLIADIIAQNIFTGTVTTDINDSLYFTAPAGTGSDWNGVYSICIESITAGLTVQPYFVNGNNLTENEYTLSITAPTEGSIYNTYTSYIGFGYSNNINSNFSGGDDPSQALPVEIIDTLNGQLYFTATNTFTSIDDFIVAFNTAGPTQATNVGINGIYTQIEFKPPLTNTGNFIYNNEDLEFYFNNSVVNFGAYANGNDITECYYSLKLYDTSNNLAGTIENLTPTNYASLNDIAVDIQNNPANTYVFGTSINVNDEIATSYPYPFVPPTSLTCSTYNNYYFILEIVYTSTQYSNYTSSASIISGGIDGYSETYEISDTVNGVIFTRAQDDFNYPNGSEVKDGLIPDFNANNTGALPLLYSAEYVSAGPATAETPATVNNSFLAELTASGITNGNEITAYIDSIGPVFTYIGKYQIPTTGALPSYTDMILGLNSNIVSNNIIAGLISFSFGTSIVQQSPPTQGAVYNGKLLKIFKKVYVPATVTLTFGNAAPFTYFRLFTDSLGTIATFQNGAGSVSASVVALTINNAINSSGTGITSTVLGTVVTVQDPPYTGGTYNDVFIKMDLYNTPPYDVGVITINGQVYSASRGFFNFPISSFQGGSQLDSLIKQAAFAGGVAPRTTTKVRFRSPLQPTNVFPYGTGNFAFNAIEDLTYDYNVGEYDIDATYSGGIDPTVGQLTVQVLDSGLNPLPPPFISNLYTDTTPQNYISRQSLASIFNATNAFPDNFQISLFPVFPLAAFLSPPTSFDYFNTHKFRYSYNYVSPQYADYVDVTTTFIGGVDPVLTHYLGEFAEGDIGPFITDNPCTPTIVTQSCLTNNQVNKIITHIDKLAK